MHAAETFEVILLLLAVILALQLLARRLHLPPAAALIGGGIALAFVPGMPVINLDPDLVLVLFLPPLLMDSAYATVLEDFRRHLSGILALAIGAVAFTTLIVGLAVHWAVPGLPWAACFALGAVVSPPDAVAAKAVLHSVRLPRSLLATLEGESLLNDAAGLVLFRFAVAAALTGSFDATQAAITFAGLALGGIAVGAAVSYLWIAGLRRLQDPFMTVVGAFLLPWAAYIGAERLGASGVISTVVAGLMLSWFQHELFSAPVRQRAHATWEVLVFILEALVFILIGLSLRSVSEHLGGFAKVLDAFAVPAAIVVVATLLARFAWVFGAEAVRPLSGLVMGRKGTARSVRSAAVMGWAGMRGVVTLAVALSLPPAMPGRELILVSAFAVILVTVLVQGTTMGAVIRLFRPPADGLDRGERLSQAEAAAQMAAAQLAAVQALAYAPDGTLLHPRLLEQFEYRARMAQGFSDAEIAHVEGRRAHYDVLLAAVTAGRQELLHLYRQGRIHDEVLQALERTLDMQELAIGSTRG